MYHWKNVGTGTRLLDKIDLNNGASDEAMFQLAQLWVEKEEEHQYSLFLDAIFRRITR